MTRNEIMNIPSGREMDAVIDSLVIGNGLKNTYKMKILDGVNEPTDDVPNYSTDMSAAWKVVEYMLFQRKIGLYLSFKNELANLLGNHLHPSWVTSLAICRAALVAINP